jgi:hypothetical protein
MSRIDDLTLRLLDGTGTAAERAELERLLDRDPRARLRHLTLLEVEATLRGREHHLDLADEVMGRIRGARTARRVRTYEQPASEAHPPRRHHRAPGRSHRRAWFVGLLLLGSAAAAGLLSGHLRRSTAEADPITQGSARLGQR